MNIHRLLGAFRDYAGFGPGIVVSLVISLMACGYVSRAMRISRAHAWALAMSLGVVLSATITPSREAILFGTQGSGTCDLGRIGLASWWELRHLDDASLNILLFAPLGIFIALCPRSRAKAIVLAGAFVLPASIELFQLVAVALDRKCQSADVFDNLTGLLRGLVGGAMAGWLAAAVYRRSR